MRSSGESADANAIKTILMKRCPFCAEEVQDAAVLCRFCQRDLPVAPPVSDWVRAMGEQRQESVPPRTEPPQIPEPPAPASQRQQSASRIVVGRTKAGAPIVASNRGQPRTTAVQRTVLGVIICVVSLSVLGMGGSMASETGTAFQAFGMLGAAAGGVLVLARFRWWVRYPVGLFAGVFIAAAVAVATETPARKQYDQEQRATREAKEATEKQALQEQQAGDKAEKAKRDAETSAAEAKKTKTKESADDACRKELQCWGDKFRAEAETYCPGAVERLAKNNFEWTDTGWLERKFSRYGWRDQALGVMTYQGDKIKFQNGFGAWIYHTYECDIHGPTHVVIGVRARPGRLPS